ncbi:MAG: hypothetical protein AB7P35_17595 [Hyphomonadaceae bacterium]
MSVWLILVVAMAVYVAADAFFNLTRRLAILVRSGLDRARAAGHALRTQVHIARVMAAPAKPVLRDALAWLWRYRVAIVLVVVFAASVSLMRGCTPIFGKSRDTLQAELKVAESNAELAEFEADLAIKAGQLALNTERTVARAREAVAEAQEDLSDAAEAVDADRLYDAYERAYDGVLHDGAPADRPDSAPPGPAPVRRPGEHAA